MNDFSFLFYASKVFWFLIQPINLVLVLLALSILMGWFGWRRLSGSALILTFLVLLLASWTSLGALMLNPLEERFSRPATAPDNVAGIIVLGGGLEGAINLASCGTTRPMRLRRPRWRSASGSA